MCMVHIAWRWLVPISPTTCEYLHPGNSAMHLEFCHGLHTNHQLLPWVLFTDKGVKKKSGYMIQTPWSHNGCYRLHKAMPRCPTMSNMPCPHASCKEHWCWWWNFQKCILLGKLYQLCHLNDKYQCSKQYVTSLSYQQFCNCTSERPLSQKQYVTSLSYQQFCNCTSERPLSQKQFAIGHVQIQFLFRMTDAMTSQNIDLPPGTSVCTENTTKIPLAIK
jgi:hypothetical protein